MTNWHSIDIEINIPRVQKKNPRRISKKQFEELKKGMAKFGACQPIVLTDNYDIIGGHQRLRAARELKWPTIPAVVALKPLTEEQVDELSIRLNKNTGEFDFDKLANEWELGDLLNWGFIDEELGLVEKDKKNNKPSLTLIFDSPSSCENAKDLLYSLSDKLLFLEIK